MQAFDDIRFFNFAAIAFELTDRCPIRCRSCLRSCSPKNQTILTFEQITSVIKRLGAIGSFREVGFSGGESFCHPDLLLRLCEYIYQHFGFSITVATNAFWAKTPKRSNEFLKPYVRVGLKSLLVSLDDFHLEYIPLSSIVNCVNSAFDLGLKVTLQVITTRKSRNKEDFQRLLKIDKGGDINWIHNPCDPIGRAIQEVPTDEFERSHLKQRTLCSILKLLSVRLDGSIVPCCGSGAEANGLIVGNAFQEDIDDVITRVNHSPIMNSLAINGGPTHLLEVLKRIGYPEFAEKKYTSQCDACFQIFNDREVTEVLAEELADEWVDWYAMRIGYQYQLIEKLRLYKSEIPVPFR